jgi:hypothetical protein
VVDFILVARALALVPDKIGTTAGRYPTRKIGLPLGKGFISRWHGRGFAGRGGKICTVAKILVFTC